VHYLNLMSFKTQYILSLTTSKARRPTIFRLETVGRRAFPVAGANIWDCIPTHITSASSLAVLKQLLKTFRRCYDII